MKEADTRGVMVCAFPTKGYNNALSFSSCMRAFTTAELIFMEFYGAGLKKLIPSYVTLGDFASYLHVTSYLHFASYLHFTS